MSIQNLITYKFTELYHILEELGLDLNFKIFLEDTEKSLNQKVKYLETIVDFLDRTLRQISNRTFTIKNAIDWRKFTSGAI